MATIDGQRRDLRLKLLVLPGRVINFSTMIIMDTTVIADTVVTPLAWLGMLMVILALLLIISFLRFGTRGARSSLYFVIVPIKQLGIFFSLSVFYVAQSTREP